MRRAANKLALLAGICACLTGLGTPRSALSAPTQEETHESAAPQIDVNAITWTDGTAWAPLATGKGKAELTLDEELQHVAHRLLREAHPISGAIIFTEAKSGRILVFSEFHRQAHAGSIALTPAPSASLFKIVTMTSLYERAHIHPKKRVCYDGGSAGIERKHLEPPPRYTGRCDAFWHALGHSRNAVFAQMATQHLLHKDLVETGAQLGFNGDVPFDTHAPFGTLEVPFNDLAFARTAAGFIGSKLSPLGAHWLTYAIATQGMAPRLTMIRQAGDFTSPRRRVLLRRLMSATSAYRLVRAMEVTVHSGTSLEAFTMPTGASYLGNIHVAGKTGTLHAHGSRATTSWFTGFAPSRKPRVIVTVLLQNGDVWRRKANEVARDVLRQYFAGRPGVTAPFAE